MMFSSNTQTKCLLRQRTIVYGLLVSLLVQAAMATHRRRLPTQHAFTNDDHANDQVQVEAHPNKPVVPQVNGTSLPPLERRTTANGFPGLPGQTPPRIVKPTVPVPEEMPQPRKDGIDKQSIPSSPVSVADSAEEKHSSPATPVSPTPLPEHPKSNHKQFELGQLYTSEIKNLFEARKEDADKTSKLQEAKAAELQATKFVSEEFRQDQLKTPYCLSLTDEVNALKDFVTAKENTRAKYIENLVTQKKAENKKAQDAADAEVAATKEKQTMLADLSEQTVAHHQSRTDLAQNFQDELKNYIDQDAIRAEADLKSALEHADKSATTVEAASVKRNDDLTAKHNALNERHTAFKGEINGKVKEIETKFDTNEADKTQRHADTLERANEKTTEVKTELNLRADDLQAAHDELRTHHTNLNGVVDTHTNNLNTAKNFMMNRFGGKKTWDEDCEIFGKWDTKQDVKATSPAASDMSEGSTNGSADNVAKAAPARRRLAADSTRGHTVVLEALLEEINRQN